jgi:hypothetical protein
MREPAPRPSGFLSALFDLRFEELVTPRLIKGLYVLVLGMTGLTVLLWVWAGLYLPAWMGWGTKVMLLLGVPAAGVFCVAVVRMFLEYMIIQFSIREELRAVRARLDKLNTLDESMHSSERPRDER